MLLHVLVFKAGAAPILSDSFDYTNGPLVTVSAGKWNTHSGTTGQVMVVSNRMFLAELPTEDVNATLAGEPYSPASGSVLYASFTLNFTNLPSASGEYFAHFKSSSSSGFRGKIF